MRHVQFMQKLCRGIALVGQLGFSLITPPVVLLWLAHWLQTKYSLGVWVTIVALILGLLTSASTALQFYRKLTAKKKRQRYAQAPAWLRRSHLTTKGVCL